MSPGDMPVREHDAALPSVRLNRGLSSSGASPPRSRSARRDGPVVPSATRVASFPRRRLDRVSEEEDSGEGMLPQPDEERLRPGEEGSRLGEGGGRLGEVRGRRLAFKQVGARIKNKLQEHRRSRLCTSRPAAGAPDERAGAGFYDVTEPSTPASSLGVGGGLRPLPSMLSSGPLETHGQEEAPRTLLIDFRQELEEHQEVDIISRSWRRIRTTARGAISWPVRAAWTRSAADSGRTCLAWLW